MLKLMIASVGFAASMILVLAEYQWVPGRRHPLITIYSLLYNWQTLLSGALAIIAGGFAILAARYQISESSVKNPPEG